jgi:hypothetical protein
LQGGRGVNIINKNPSKLFVTSSLSLLVALGLLGSYFATMSFSSTAVQPLARIGDPVKEIAGYRGWMKVNREPQIMPERTAALCAPAALPTTDVDGPKNPHRHKYLTVYVNEVGRQAMIGQLKPSFPEGSVIVKEKLPDPSSQVPELMTVMIKRGKGFNPASGDWEYMVVDGTGTKVLAQGKLEACQSCHTVNPGSDYVFRTYLPNEAWTRMK